MYELQGCYFHHCTLQIETIESEGGGLKCHNIIGGLNEADAKSRT